MTALGWLQILVVLLAVAATAVPLGRYIDDVMAGRRTALSRLLGPVERALYAAAGIDPAREQGWRGYTLAVLGFSAVGFLTLYGLQRLQGALPLNPQGFDAVEPGLAFNTALSFVTNTNWQNYAGETTMTHLTQMLGLTVHNFVSAATGLGVALAVARALARNESATVGNFWADLTRATLHLLLPLAVLVALLMAALGVPQTLRAAAEATPLEGAKQVLSLGPVASQEAIKELGTNGGGFFNANSAHPFENPGPWTTALQLWSLLAIPAATVVAFGRMVGAPREGRAILVTMGAVLLAGTALVYGAESAGNPLLTALGVDAAAGNLEGHELRVGQPLTALYAAATTGTSTGAVVAMHDSLTPLAGLAPLFNMLLGCITPGGVGSGLYGILVLAVVAVFVAGLMVGRTPEYLGKKIEAREMKLAMLAVLLYPLLVLGFTAGSLTLQTGLDSLGNAGPHGLSETLYAFASAAANNGSAFGGLSGNTPWLNTALGLVMGLGRFAHIVPVLALAGSLAAKKKAAATAGTFPTDGPLFVGLLLGVIVILYLLQYFPVLALGPVVEHLAMSAGKTY